MNKRPRKYFRFITLVRCDTHETEQILKDYLNDPHYKKYCRYASVLLGGWDLALECQIPISNFHPTFITEEMLKPLEKFVESSKIVKTYTIYLQVDDSVPTDKLNDLNEFFYIFMEVTPLRARALINELNDDFIRLSQSETNFDGSIIYSAPTVGEYDVLLAVSAKNEAFFQNVLFNILTQRPGIQNTVSLMAYNGRKLIGG